MKSAPKAFLILAIVCALLAISSANGQLTKIGEYKLHQHEDHGVRFATALNHDHTLFTLVARRNGKWLLTKVTNWWGPQPQEERLVVNALSEKDHLSGFGQVRLVPTPDGKSLISLVWADIKTPKGAPNQALLLIDIVRLSPFQVVASLRSKEAGYVQAFVAPSGRILVNSSLYPSAHEVKANILQKYSLLTVPGLHEQSRCSYTVPIRAPASKPGGSIEKDIEAACGRFAKRSGYSSALEMDKVARNDAVHPIPPNVNDDFFGWQFIHGANNEWIGMSPNSEDLAKFNANGSLIRKFQPNSMCAKQTVRGPSWLCGCHFLGGFADNTIISCNTSHDNFFGWNVDLRQWIAEIDTKHARDLSRIDIPIRDNFDARFVYIGSRKLLLIVINGSRLEVFSVA